MKIRDLLTKIRRTKEEPFGADALGLFRVRTRLPTVTVTEGLLEKLSAIVEPLAKGEVDKVVARWKEKREAEGYQFTGDQSDTLISYYDEVKKTIVPSYRLTVRSGGMEVILRADKFSELRRRLELIERGIVKELRVEFTSRDFHLGIELKDSLILRPSLTVAGRDKRRVASLFKGILSCLAEHGNPNGFVDNPLSLLLFPFFLGFLLLNTLFRLLGGVSFGGAFLFGLFLNVPLFLLIVFLLRKGFPLVEFRVAKEEMGRVGWLKAVFFLVGFGIVVFSILTRV